MFKIKKSVVAALAAVASFSLSSCGKETGNVLFWDAFGSKYSTKLQNIMADVGEKLGQEIEYDTKGSYPGIRKAVIDAIANVVYPTVAVGYPDHFAQYQGKEILIQLDKYFKKADLADYDENYMPENYLYDTDGEKHLYGIPFNKSTELLGYNGVFVDYCDFLYPGENLKVLPKTWSEWGAAKTNPTSKTGRYYSTFKSLVENKKVIYANQDTEGTATGFVEVTNESEKAAALGAGKKEVFNYSETDINTTMLFTWDSTDNAFITMLRQFGAEYTKLPESEFNKNPLRRYGHVLFANDANIDKTVNMLKFFNGMSKDKIFGIPSDLATAASYSSESFAKGNVMFMICSSGGLSYNTDNWNRRFRLAPIPYTDEQHKLVISQGANLCLTDNGPTKKGVEVIKALTRGEFQTRWCIETGYFPAAVSASSSPEYQAFLNDTSYTDSILVTYREGAKVNENFYRKASENWTRFVDDAFIGSAVIREEIAYVFPTVFTNVSDVNNLDGYKQVLKDILQKETIAKNQNIFVETSLF